MAKTLLYDSHGNPLISNKPPVHDLNQTPGERANNWGTIDLKPSAIVAALRAANDGELLQLAILVRSMMEGWPHLRAEFGKLKISVGFTATEILPDPDTVNKAQMDRNVELCKLQMRMLNKRLLAMQLVDTRAYSIETQELGWQYIDGKWLVATCDHVDPEAIALDSETGRYTVYNTDESKYELMEAYRYLVATNSEYSGHPFRGGQLRALVWWYLLIRQNLTELYAFLQIYGLPFRYAIGDCTDKDAATAMENGLRKLGMDAYAVFDKAEGWQIEVKTVPEASHAIFKDINDLANAEASKICVGQTLTAEPGKSGSWALGTVHEGVAQRIRESACGDVSEAIENGVFWPLIYYNEGPEAAKELPIYRFKCEPPEDTKSLEELYEGLMNRVGIWDTVPRKHLHDKFGIPSTRPIKDDEVVLPMELQKIIVASMFGQAGTSAQADTGEPDKLRKVASEERTTRKPTDAFEGIVQALSQKEAGAGGAFTREVSKIKDLIGKQAKSGNSITDAQNLIAIYGAEHNGDPKFTEIMYKVLGVAKALGYYDAKFRQADEIARLK